MSKLFWASVLAIVVCIALSVGFADIPKTINFQGRLSSSDGVPLSGLHDITVKIYGVRDTLLFTEEHSDVAVTNGVFNLLVGSRTVGGVPSSVFVTPDTSIGVMVDDGEEMTPRQSIAAVPYAYFAESAHTFILPIDKTAASIGTLFRLKNTSSGEAIVGISSEGTAVRGSSDATAGENYGGHFVGNSQEGAGLLAESTAGYGVLAIHSHSTLAAPAVKGLNRGAGDGVMGDCEGSGAGVRGSGYDGPGVIGASWNHNGVVGLYGGNSVGYTNVGAGVFGKSIAGPGGRFESETGLAVHAIGEVKADSFSYNTEQTRLLDFGPAAFRPSTLKNYSCPHGNGGAFIEDEGWGHLSAPVDLPDGAVVTRMTAYFWDNNEDYDLSFRLRAHSNVILPYIMAQFNSTDVGGHGSAFTTNISTPTIDKADKSYELQVRAYWPGDDGTLRVNRVVLEYKIEQPD